MGCLNTACCSGIKSEIISPFSDLYGILILMCTFGFLSYISVVALFTTLQKGNRQIPKHALLEKVLAGLFATIGVLSALFIFMNRASEGNFHVMENLLTAPALESQKNPLKIDERYLSFNGFFDIFDIVIREDTDPCIKLGGSCGSLTYQVSLEVNKGLLRFNPLFDQTRVTIT